MFLGIPVEQSLTSNSKPRDVSYSEGAEKSQQITCLQTKKSLSYHSVQEPNRIIDSIFREPAPSHFLIKNKDLLFLRNYSNN